MPCGHTKDGLPVGLQIVARRTRDEQALQAAAAYTTAFPQHIVTPSRLAALQ